MGNSLTKGWMRILLFCLFAAVLCTCVLSSFGAAVAFEDGWYYGTQEFAESRMCRSLVSDDLEDILQNMYISTTLEHLRFDPAFSYRIVTDSGDVLLDTTGKGAVYVMDYTLYPPYESIFMADFNEPAFLEGYVNLPITLESGSRYYTAYQQFYALVRYSRFFLPCAIVSLGLLIPLFVLLLAFAGKHPDDTIGPRGLDKLPFELYTGGALLAIYLFAVLCSLINDYGFFPRMAVIGVAVCFGIATATLWLMSILARIRGKAFFRTTLLYWLYRLWKKIFTGASRIQLVWRTALCFAAYLFFNLLGVFVMFNSYGLFAVLAFLFLLFWNISAGVLLVLYAIDLRRLQKAGEAMAAGYFDQQPDFALRFPDLQTHSMHLAAVGRGMNLAVENRMRSERMKTELITNVSHDLKTPLTSIVTYIDLLSCCKLEGEAAEYLEVLNRQALRLKKLTEDLVDASKAASGTLTLSREVLDLTELVHQAAGECSQRLEDAGLTPVLMLPEEPVRIVSDSRYLWRVLDNLLSNAVKYTLTGTRVYVSVHQEQGSAVLMVKNISAAILTVSGEELTERFVRGDASRSTEGSGLGLSITKSLVELMGGRLEIIVDGDLFKAVVIFPLAMQ